MVECARAAAKASGLRRHPLRSDPPQDPPTLETEYVAANAAIRANALMLEKASSRPVSGKPAGSSSEVTATAWFLPGSRSRHTQGVRSRLDVPLGVAPPRPRDPDETCPNGSVRSRLTSPERSFFKPGPLRTTSNPLSYRAFNIRTKTAVVRLLRRKGPERGEKRPEMGFRAGARGSEKWPERPAFCGVPADAETRKKNVLNGETGGGRGTVVKPSLR